jgi:hypothetical protein
MAEEKRDDKAGVPFKMLLEEALMRQRNEMMDNFAHILRRLSMAAVEASSISNHFAEVQRPSRYKSFLISPYLKVR